VSDDARSENRRSIGPSSDRLEAYADDIHLMYDDVEYSIEELTRYSEPVIFRGAPGVGKTTSLFKVAYKKNEPVTYLAARRDMYESAEQKALEAGFESDDIAIVPSPFEECPTFMGAHGDEMEAEYNSLYSVGIGAAYFHESDSKPSPCHTVTRRCPYMIQRIEDPDEYEVIIGHYKHALNEKLIRDRLTFVDEFAQDDSITTVTKTGLDDDTHLRIGRALDGYFSYADFLPGNSFDHFIALLSAGQIKNPEMHAGDILCHPDGSGGGLVVSEQDLLEMDPDKRFHKRAPTIVFGLLLAEDLGNEWHSWTSSPAFAQEFENLSESFAVARNDPNNYDNLEVYMLEPTDLSAASQVIGLDGTARKVMWDTIFEQDFTIENFITDDQMPTYVKDVQGMELWQSCTKARPYAGGNRGYISWEANASTALYARMKRGKPVVITPKKAASVLEQEIEETFEKDVKPVEVTTSSGTEVENVMNFAMVRSNNEAAGSEAICIFGCPQPSDDVFNRWGALMGVGVERVEGSKGMDLEFEPQPVAQEIYEHFTLDDVEQAIMRGRRGNDDDEGSTVIVGTGKTPSWFTPDVPLNISDESPFRSDTRRQLIRYLMQKGQATSTEIRDETGFSRSGLHHAMSPLLEDEMVEKESQPGRASIYTWNGTG
jgi:hypothetical protein